MADRGLVFFLTGLYNSIEEKSTIFKSNPKNKAIFDILSFIVTIYDLKFF